MTAIAAFLCGLLYGELLNNYWREERKRKRREATANLAEWLSAVNDLARIGGGDPANFAQCAEPFASDRYYLNPCGDKPDCDSTCGDACQCSTSVPAGDNTTGCMDG